MLVMAILKDGVFTIDTVKKTFTITLVGFAAEERASVFVDNLKRNVAKINPKDYVLIVDSTELKTFKPQILPVLEQAYALYMSFGFRKILMVNPRRVTPRLQLKRIAKKCNFTGLFIDTLQDALNMI
jgi:hypothetical protein